MSVLPEKFVLLMREWHGAEAADAWLERLPALLEEWSERWQLTILPPFDYLALHYVAPAFRADGTPVVLKTSQLSDEFDNALAALRIFDGRGIARVLEWDEDQKVMVMERLQPGTMLDSLVPEQDEQATSILADIGRQLWRPAPEQHPFPTVEQMGYGLTELREHYAGGYGLFPPRLVDEATDLFAAFSASAAQPLLLHGDLQHHNILRSGDGWRAIDPKGVVGDPGYDLGAIFYNPMPDILEIDDLDRVMARRVAQFSEELDMERERVRGWGLVRCVLTAWGMVSNNLMNLNPDAILRCADTLSRLKV